MNSKRGNRKGTRPATIAGAVITLFILIAIALVIALPVIAGVLLGSGGAFSISGMLVHANDSTGIISYQNMTPATRTLGAVGPGSTITSENIRFLRLEHSHENNESLIALRTTQDAIYTQTWNGSAWSAHTQHSSGSQNDDNVQSFDIAYEQVSGDALLVYEDNVTAGDTRIRYRIWNYTGKTWLTEQLYQHGYSRELENIRLYPKPKSDDIMMLATVETDNVLIGIKWNGTAFDNATAVNLSIDLPLTDREVFSFSWETLSGDGIVFFGEGNSGEVRYAVYSQSSNNWANDVLLWDQGGAQNIEQVKTCADPTSDNIAIFAKDSGDDTEAGIWNGAALETNVSRPSEGTDGEPTGAGNENIDCAWTQDGLYALFTYAKGGNADDKDISWFYYNRSNWSLADIDNSPQFDISGNTNSLEQIRLSSNPLRSEILAVTTHSGNAAAGYTSLWNFSSNWSTGVQFSPDLDCGAAGDCSQFSWDIYDPAPNVTLVIPIDNDTNIDANNSVAFNVTITDNINVSAVLINITLPNGSNTSFQLFNVTTNFSGTFNRTEVNGFYNFTIVANDTGTHNNLNRTVTGSFSAGDVWEPNVSVVLPNANTSVLENVVVELRINASDDRGISTVQANVTLPNGLVDVVNLSNTSTGLYAVNFTNTSQKGLYSIVYTANDTSNLINSTVTDTFGIVDFVSPTVKNLTPANSTNFAQNVQVNFSVNVTDNGNISAVIINVTFPNGSVQELNMTNVTKDIYNASVNATATGTYNTTVFANDTAYNKNRSVTGNFTIDFNNAPTIVLSTPINGHNQTSPNLTFNYSVTDDRSTTISTCTLYINDAANTTNTTITNNSVVTIVVTNFTSAKRNWSVNCTDGESKLNASLLRNFTIDRDPPAAINNSFTPNSEDRIDPNVSLNITTGILDLVSGVQEARYQFRLNGNGSTFTNVSMVEISGSGTWHVNWTPNINGTFFYRFFMVDNFNNSNTSPTLNTSVQFDNTWTQTPTTNPTINVLPSSNFNLVNITFNNSGDFVMNFSMTADRSNTTFNSTFPITIQPNQTATVEINDTSPATTGLISVTFTGNATPNGNPSSRTSTASFVVAKDAFLTTNFINSPSLTVTQQDTGISYTGQVKNVGNKSAENVTIQFTLPPDWSTGGNTSSSVISSLAVNDTESYTISVDIASNATTGGQLIEVNASGVNTSGTNLSSVQSTIGEKLNVTVKAFVDVTTSTSSGSSTSTSGDSGSSSSSTGGSSVKGGLVKKAVGLGETIHTTEVFEILRGKTQGIPITVSNIYENAVLKDIGVEVQGFMSQYVVITPVFDPNKLVHVDTRNVKLAKVDEKIRFRLANMAEHSLTARTIGKKSVSVSLQSKEINFTIKNGDTQHFDVTNDSVDDIAIELHEINNNSEALFRVHKLGTPKEDVLYFGEGRNYSLSIFAPPYLQQQDYNLTIKITGKLVPLNETLAGFAWRPLTEFRKLLFVVHEVSEKDAQFSLKEAQAHVAAMEAAGMPITRVQKILTEAVEALTKNDYGKAAQLGEKIARLRKRAFDAHEFITEVEKGIAKAKSEWLNVPETEQVLALAQKAFEREDFYTALQRAKDAQLLLLLETKGRLNIIWFLLMYWWAIILGGIVFMAGGFFTYKKVYVLIIATRLRNLAKEDESIHALMKEAQTQHLNEGSISASQYHRMMAQYTARLTKIKQLTNRLRSKRVGILKTEEELASLKDEEKELLGLMKKAQVEYLEKGTLTRSKFMEEYESEKERLAEVAEEREVLREKLSKEKISKKHKFLTKVNQIALLIQAWIEKRKIPPLHIQEKKAKMVKKLKRRYDEQKGDNKKNQKEQPSAEEEKEAKPMIHKVKEKLGEAKEKVIGLLKKAPTPKEIKEKLGKKIKSAAKKGEPKSLVEEAEELLDEAEEELIEEADNALQHKEKKNLKDDMEQKQSRGEIDAKDVLNNIIRKRKTSFMNKIKRKIQKTVRRKKKTLRKKIEYYNQKHHQDSPATEKKIAAKVAKQLEDLKVKGLKELNKIGKIPEKKSNPLEERAAKKQLSQMIVRPVLKKHIQERHTPKRHKPRLREVKKALHDVAEKVEPQQSKVKELMRHFPGALKRDEWKKALMLEEQQRKKNRKGLETKNQSSKQKRTLTKTPTKPQPEQRHMLSQQPEAKKKREQIYKNLRDKFGIKAQEPQYKKE